MTRVLVIDDEAPLCRLLARALEGEHEVVALTHAREALDRIVAGEHFDAILCDLIMPEMTGMDFVDRLESTAPELLDLVVIITGGAYTPSAAAFFEQTALPRLEKPFHLAELRAAVHERLAHRAAEPRKRNDRLADVLCLPA